MEPFIVYDSLTGNVKRFVSKLGYRNIQISENLMVNEPYILLTYTIGRGNVPSTTIEFLNRNSLFLSGVSSSGNKNWGAAYGKAAKVISVKYGVPVLNIFELSGTSEDINIFKREAEKLCQRISQNGFNITMK